MDIPHLRLRHGIKKHLENGNMDGLSFAIYCYMLLYADFETGIYFGSSGKIQHYLKDFSLKQIRQRLIKMETSNPTYIKRIRIKKRGNYHILINKYMVTQGEHKGKYLNADKSNSLDNIIYEQRNSKVESEGNSKGNSEVYSEGNTTIKEFKEFKESKKYIYTPDFEDFWKVYPLKKSKNKAFQKWKGAINSGISKDTIINGAVKYANSVKNTEQRYIKHPDGWIEAGRWEDEDNEHPTKNYVKKGDWEREHGIEI